ncbi:MAG: hypothetical protein L6R30_18200 [Thermoanaerobaculia bacterium]|nr:hypothetical protein [Thermoanaerobaculia bacterium]MCK6684338.1 hypothetical protein [Thermoanaerobaculia bacterium]
MFFFPNGEWVFNDDHILRIRITDSPSPDPGKVGSLIELKSYSLIMGAYRGDTFPLSRITLVGDKHLRADFRTSKIRGTLDLTVDTYGQANLKYETLNLPKNISQSAWSSNVQSRIFKPARAGGKNLRVAISSGDVAGLKAGYSATLGNVYVRDLDVMWEYIYAMAVGGAGAGAGLSPFPKTTNYHEVYPDPPCPNWDGASVSLYTRGVDALLVSVGSKMEICFNLPNGAKAFIEESSWCEFTLPSVKADLSTLQIGVLTVLSDGRPYLGT